MKTLLISIIMMMASSNSYSLGTATISNRLSIEVKYSPEELASFEFNKFGERGRILGVLKTKIVDPKLEITRAVQEDFLVLVSDKYESLRGELRCSITVSQRWASGNSLTDDLEEVSDNIISTSIGISMGWDYSNSESDISKARECVQRVVSAHLKEAKTKPSVRFEAESVYKAQE